METPNFQEKAHYFVFYRELLYHTICFFPDDHFFGTIGMTVSVKSHVVIAREKLQNALSSLY